MSDNPSQVEQGAEAEAQKAEKAEKAVVDPAEAAGKEAARQVPSKPKLDETKLTPEMRAEVEALIKAERESAASRAVNEYKRKTEESGQYKTQEEVERMVQDAIKDERERSRLENEARDSFNAELGKLGISPGSDKYKAVALAYTRMEEAGAITPKALLTTEGVKALAFAAGVIESSEASGPQRGFDSTYRLELDPPSKDGPKTTEDLMWEKVNAALGKT